MNSVPPPSEEPLVVLAHLMVSGADFDRLTHEVVCATAMNLRADLCEFLLTTSDGKAVFRVSSLEDKSDQEARAAPIGVSSLAGYTLLCRTPVVSEDLRKERRFGSNGAPPLAGAVSAVSAPLPGRGGALGVLVAYAARESAFGASQGLYVSRVASLLGGAIERLKEWDELLRTLEETKLNGVVSHPSHERVPENGDHGLTDRQMEVLRLLADGLPAKRIASDMGISIHTVHFHQRNLYRTLGVVSSTGAIKKAREFGLL